MYIVIVGCGNLGLHLVRSFIAVGNEVLVIEKNQETYETLYDELGSAIRKGDGTDPSTLEQAGVSRCDVFICTVAQDEVSLAACQMAKTNFGAPKTISIIKSPQNEALFKLLGVDHTVTPMHLAASRIEEDIEGRPLVHLMNLKASGLELLTVSIPTHSAVIDKSLGSIKLPPNSFVSLIVKNTGTLLPSAEITLEPGDDLVFVTNADEEQILYEIFTGVE